MLDSNWLELLEALDQASCCSSCSSCASCASSVCHSSLSASQPPHQTPPAPRLRLRQPRFGAGGARRLRDAPEPESQAQWRGKKRRRGVGGVLPLCQVAETQSWRSVRRMEMEDTDHGGTLDKSPTQVCFTGCWGAAAGGSFPGAALGSLGHPFR